MSESPANVSRRRQIGSVVCAPLVDRGVLYVGTNDGFLVAVDSQTGVEILALIQDLHARLGSTVVIVTHDMKVAESCGRTIALRDGRIVEDVRRAAAYKSA